MSQQAAPRLSSLPGVSLFLALAGLLAGCGHDPNRRAEPLALPAVAVTTQTAQCKTRLATEEVVGTVRARLRATLEAKLSGRITEMPVVLGQSVKAGQLVARLDAAEIKARLDQAEALRDQAQRDWKRVSALYEGQTVTRSELDQAESRRRVADAAVAEAQALNAYVDISAPFDAVVTKKWVDLGDLAAPGKPLLDLEAPSALQLDADLPETIAARVHLGDKLPVAVDALKEEVSATVTELAPAADALSRTLRVKLDLSPAAGLRSGQFARLRVPVGENRAVRVPLSAVVRRGQMEIVFVVANGRAVMRLVKTGCRVGQEVELLSGIDADDAVVTEGAARLTDGQPVL